MADEYAQQDLPDMDQRTALMPNDVRKDLAVAGETSLYFFAKNLLGYSDMTPGCHGPLCTFLDDNPSKYKLTLMPRGHFKTSVATIGRNLQKVMRNPNERILLANETSTNAQRFLSAIRQHVESNRKFRAVYSHRLPKDTRKMAHWNNESLSFPRTWMGPEPTIDTCGMTGAMTSRHYTHLCVDDPISEEATKSAAVMQNVITRIDKIVSLMVKPEEDTFDLTGTRWAVFDVYSWFQKSYGKKLARFVRAAIEDGEPIFPELISLETLAQARTNMGEYMFSCLYMNNPRVSDMQDFNVQDLMFWRWSADGESVVLYNTDGEASKLWHISQLDITVTVDLAVSEKITSDRNAVITVGASPDGEAIVLDCFAKRCSPLEVIEHLFWIHDKYHARAYGIESVAYQKAFKYFLRAEMEKRGVYMNIEDVKALPSKRGTGNNTKELRIRGLQPILATRRLYVDPKMHILRNEMADFPLGEHDDALDALSMQLTMWRNIMSIERRTKYLASEEQFLASFTGYGDAVHDEDEDLDYEVGRFGPVHDYVIEE